ncbi:hypothetical protein BD289DRAFT_447885 [Coniella lustricola]|uniref:Uncharacterized protein n=1 Tax=Coniella lustricola TaxID=2025994 RepID=A0A2T2ZSM8_9PEZI|nr:hypothetical protein BD289DRAFT_447885 [Coniella lustricola]
MEKGEGPARNMTGETLVAVNTLPTHGTGHGAGAASGGHATTTTTTTTALSLAAGAIANTSTTWTTPQKGYSHSHAYSKSNSNANSLTVDTTPRSGAAAGRDSGSRRRAGRRGDGRPISPVSSSDRASLSDVSPVSPDPNGLPLQQPSPISRAAPEPSTGMAMTVSPSEARLVRIPSRPGSASASSLAGSGGGHRKVNGPEWPAARPGMRRPEPAQGPAQGPSQGSAQRQAPSRPIYHDDAGWRPLTGTNTTTSARRPSQSSSHRHAAAYQYGPGLYPHQRRPLPPSQSQYPGQRSGSRPGPGSGPRRLDPADPRPPPLSIKKYDGMIGQVDTGADGYQPHKAAATTAVAELSGGYKAYRPPVMDNNKDNHLSAQHRTSYTSLGASSIASSDALVPEAWPVPPTTPRTTPEQY